MTSPCTLLVGLAFGVLLILLLPWALARLAGGSAQQAELKRSTFCDQLCRIRIALAFMLGLAIGALIIVCRGEIGRVLRDGPACLTLLFILLVLAFLAAIWLVLRMLECRPGFRGLPPIIGNREKIATARYSYAVAAYSPYAILVILAALVLWRVQRACGLPLSRVLYATTCGKLLLLVILLAIAFLVVRALELRYCPSKPTDRECCQRILRTWMTILFLLLLGALIAAIVCGDDVREGDFDLAMAGIHWDGKYPDESGAHLRWAFRYGLPFPEGGFDLFRRPASGGSWTLLNSEGRIHPARVWDGPVPGPGPVWKGRGKDRLPPAVHPRFEGPNAVNFDQLADMVGRPPYQLLYYVEGRGDPFVSEADAQAFAAAAGEPRVQWQLEPMTVLLTMALHPEIARLLGLYYIDTTAGPGESYDYRVVGYWSDRQRSYTVKNLTRATTPALVAPPMERVDTIVGPARPLPTGDYWPTEASVAIRWRPPTTIPDVALSAADGIRPVLYLPERQDLGPLDAPGAPMDDGFEPLKRPDDTGVFVPVDPIAVVPEEVEGAPDQWSAYFAYDYWVDYRVYAYRVVGIDIFGRRSTPSAPLTVEVHDVTGPAAPVEIQARVYQRSDPQVARLLPANRDALFPPGSTHEIAVRVVWKWPEFLRLRYPDTKEFRIYYKFDGYESFADPASVDLWRDAAQWEGSLTSVPLTVPPPPDDGYEAVLTSLPPAVVAEITADDDRPVVYGFVSVAAVDHDPFNNVGAVASPFTVLTRDFIPPPAPVPPTLLESPGAPDDAGYARLTLRVADADRRYRYQFFRVRDRTLLTLPVASLPGACAPDPDPTVLGLQGRAHANPDNYGLVTATPVSSREPTAAVWVADFTDRLDASISQRFLYAARAVDPAGNVSEFSCPSLEVLSRDGMPPRPPVVVEVVGGEGSITLTWSTNTEQDLERYEIYRTTEEARLTSKRKMTLALAADATGSAVVPTPGATSATMLTVAGDTRLRWTDTGLRGARDYFYRLVAVDLAGNASRLSDPVGGRAIDTTPPAAVQWNTTNPIVWAPNAEGRDVPHLTWQPLPNEPDVRFQVQRQQVGSAAWLAVSGWLSDVTYVDNSAQEGVSYRYRLRAMDALGNRGAWSMVQTTP
jgi:hypothetical protein